MSAWEAGQYHFGLFGEVLAAASAWQRTKVKADCQRDAIIEFVQKNDSALFTTGVVVCGRFLLLVTDHGTIRVKDLALLALLSVIMGGLGVYNMVAFCSSQCLTYLSWKIEPATADAKDRFNREVCAAYCHLHTNSSSVSSCGALPAPALVDFAKQADISQWCDMRSDFRGRSPFDQLRDLLSCASLDGWSSALFALVVLTFALGMGLSFGFIRFAILNACHSRASTAPSHEKEKPKLTEKLVDGLASDV